MAAEVDKREDDIAYIEEWLAAKHVTLWPPIQRTITHPKSRRLTAEWVHDGIIEPLLGDIMRGLIGVIRELTTESPYRDDAMGYAVCFWCDSLEHEVHEPDCPWLKARDLIERSSG